jgi:hypothetical protein
LGRGCAVFSVYRTALSEISARRDAAPWGQENKFRLRLFAR